MRFHADLHVHSKYSRATSRDLDLEHLAYWAARKGICVVGTGDFCHPAWRAEIGDKLTPAEPGLFRLRADLEQAVQAKLPAACRTPVRFLLEVEISTIYKKGDKTRKVHHLIYAPDLATVDRMSAALARIGNIASDGRPILGLDSRNLLDIALDSGPDAYLVPAHIWTPWFAALGSMSGFDSIVECYGDLADHIFAVETGLSSDPPMNWRLSMLDRYRLTSNSDAHSPGKLGREATTFDCDLDYFAIRNALKTGQGYVGTVEFFPEEGKYHLDGHRKCEVRLTPKETLALGGRCPVCGQPVTVGVEHRVEALADRSVEEVTPPATAGAVSNLVPLPEMLSEITGSGPSSKAVEGSYDHALAKLGAELDILQRVPVEDISHAGSPLLAEAVARLRAGQVIRDAGYDGEYGVIRLFEESELKRLTKGGLLFDAPVVKRARAAAEAAGRIGAAGAGVGGCPSQATAPHPRPLPATSLRSAGGGETASSVLDALDDAQRAAAATRGPLVIVAGPGSGKTRVLTHRIVHLVADCGVPPENCLAITFTRRAAGELHERLHDLLPSQAGRLAIHTFHSFGLAILREHGTAVGLHSSFRIATEAERVTALAETLDVSEHKADRLLRAISTAKRTRAAPDADVAHAMAVYRRVLSARNWVDFDDLVGLLVETLGTNAAIAGQIRARFRSIAIDEFQDVDEQQYRLMRLLAAPDAELCVIGDPDQAIYGFRGGNASCFERLRQDYPNAKVLYLARNYRSSGTIVAASAQVIGAGRQPGIAEAVRDMQARISVHVAPTEAAEAEHVVKSIEGMIGGHSFFSIDSGRGGDIAPRDLSFSDFAVLYRTDAQSAELCEAFARSGIPFKRHAHEPFAADRAVRALMHELDDIDRDPPLAAQLRAAADRVPRGDDAPEQAAVITAWQRLTRLAETCGDDWTRFQDAVVVATEADFFDPRADRVALLTLHAAKGLEFRVVFIVGLEDGLLPLVFGTREEAAMAEERRLFYVGMTRAKDWLVLSRAQRRLWRGAVRWLEASPFLADIESELLKPQQSELPRRKIEDRQLKLF
jgi:uncharacterized protein (TIGR00375 family)